MQSAQYRVVVKGAFDSLLRTDCRRAQARFADDCLPTQLTQAPSSPRTFSESPAAILFDFVELRGDLWLDLAQRGTSGLMRPKSLQDVCGDLARIARPRVGERRPDCAQHSQHRRPLVWR